MTKPIVMPDNTVTIEQMCSMLMISQATARNWIKSGKIKSVKTVGRRLCFSRADVEKLLESIESGESDKLTRRRNKTKHTGNMVPAGYVAKKEYTETAKRIVAQFDALGGGDELMKLILAEYSAKLLYSRGLINECHGIYIQAFLKDEACFGIYGRLIFDILVGCGIGLKDIDRYSPALCENVEYLESEDFLGLLYMSISSIAKRKTEGVYYTPKKIAEDCANYLNQKGAFDKKRILDPCCGTGNFLINALEILMQKYPALTGAEIIDRQLFAADIDPVSICLARVNMTLTARMSDIEVLYTNFKVTDSLFDFDDDSFDTIVSNPPWGSAYSVEYERRVREQFAMSSLCYVESFSVFLMKALQICKEGGTVCYVLPQSFLNVQAHEKLREYVGENCDIVKVKYWKNIFDKVYAPCISVTLSKGKTAAAAIEVESDGKTYTINSARLTKSNIYNFSVSDAENDIIVKLEETKDSVRLFGNADFALGIVTGDNNAYLKDRRFKDMEPVLRGTDIYAYVYQKPEKYLRFDPKKFQQVAPEHYYRAPEKLFYKFVSSSLCFAYDDKQTLSLNSCNVLIPRFEDIPIKYILAVLNSSAAHFYFTNKFQSVKVLRSHIENIPIPVGEPCDYKLVCELVDELLCSKNAPLQAIIAEKLDTLVMDRFNLSESEREIIKNSRV